MEAEPAAPPGKLVLEGVRKVFRTGRGEVVALEDVSLSVGEGEFVCLVGPSGCGKSTLLNLVAGLDAPDAGTVLVDGAPVVGPGRDRMVMFQESALFPWLSVRGNIRLALRLAGIPKAERDDRASDLLRMVRLKGMGGKRPHELSGGMRQRVALARALAQNASVLLMDEPFGALDAITRDLLHDEIERVWLETGITIVFVTHNVREGGRLGDRVMVVSSRPGRVVEEFRIDTLRPRRLDDPEVSSLSGLITDRLRQEVRRHGA
jgi:NitT/TauT family transport system ATP-binding protein